MVNTAMVAEISERQLAILEDPAGKIVWMSRRMAQSGLLGERVVVGRTLANVLGVDMARRVKRALGHRQPARATIGGAVYQVASSEMADQFTARTFTQVA